MAEKDNIIGTLKGLEVGLQDLTTNTSYNVTVTLANNIYTINEYDANGTTLIATCQVNNEGRLLTNSEEFQNNKILVRAYNILFNYYLITNQVRNREVILENTSDKFIIKGATNPEIDYGNPYHISLAPNSNP